MSSIRLGRALPALLGASILFTGAAAPPLAAEVSLAELVQSAQDPDPQERGKAARALGKVGTQEAAQVLVRLLSDPSDFVHDESVESLAGLEDPEIFRWLSEKALPGAKDGRALAGVASVLATKGLSETAPDLAKAARSAKPDARIALLRALGVLGRGDAAALEAVKDDIDHSDALVRATALETLSDLAPGEAEPPLVAALSDRDFQVRVAALEALERVSATASLEHAKTLVEDPHWSVRVAAIGVIRRSGDKTAIPLLVAQLKKEDGRLRKDISDALLAMASTDGAAEESQVIYYGLAIFSKRVLFVTDLSQGMKEPVPGTGKTRIAIAQEEYVKVLAAYPADGYFNLVVFATEVAPWQRRLVPGGVPAKNQSAKWLADRVQEWIFARSTGRTNFYDSLALTFEDSNIDTVIFLSDATSITEGTYRTKGDILRKLADKNRYRKIQFHTIGIGKHKDPKPARGIMKDLAESTGGTFLEADG